MKKILVAALVLLSSLPAIAQSFGITAVEVPNLAAVRATSYGANFHLQGSLTPGDGAEGYFAFEGMVCADDNGATYIKDKGGRCFKRLTAGGGGITPQALGAKCDGATADNAAFTAAQSLPAALGPIVLNSGTCLLTGNITLTREMVFHGGKLKPTGTATINGPVYASDYLQVFDITGGGTIAGNMQVAGISPLWFGAKNDNTSSAATVTAFQAASNYAQQALSLNPTLVINIPAGSYNLGSGAYGVQTNGANWCPKFIGQGPGITTINFTPASEGAAFLFNSSIGQCNGGGVFDLRVAGNSNTVGCEFLSTNNGGCRIEASSIKTLALLCSCSSGGFVENARITIQGTSSAKNFINYRCNSGGSCSFRDSGCFDCFVSLFAGSPDAVVLAEGGSFPYSIPMNISVNVQSAGANYFIDNQTSNLISTYGDQQIEVDGASTSLTLAKSGGVSFGGSQQTQIAGGQLIYGSSTFATQAGYNGGNQSFKNSFYVVDNAASAVQYLAAGTGVTTTLTTVRAGGPQFCNLQLYNGSTYNWSGTVQSTGSGLGQYSIAIVSGHRFFGANDPVFGFSGASWTITMADTVAANSTRVFGVCYIAGEQQ